MAGHLILKMRPNGAKILLNGGKMLAPFGAREQARSTWVGMAIPHHRPPTRSRQREAFSAPLGAFLFSALSHFPDEHRDVIFQRPSEANGRNIRPHFPLNNRSLQTASN